MSFTERVSGAKSKRGDLETFGLAIAIIESFETKIQQHIPEKSNKAHAGESPRSVTCCGRLCRNRAAGPPTLASFPLEERREDLVNFTLSTCQIDTCTTKNSV